MIDMTFFVCLINPMFHLNKLIMKDLLFKKSLLVPFLLMFALFFSSCDKDKDEQNGDKSLEVTVNFTGTVIPEPGDELHVVLVYSPFLEVDMENDGPDDMLTHTLDANDITNGKTLTFTNINPFEEEIYVAAFVDTNENGAEEGELIECYNDLSAYEIMSGEKDATNVAGKTAITIDLDKVGLGRSLDVTVNFTGTTKPLPGQKLYVSLFYSPLTEFYTEHGSEPDIMQSHILTANDIANGKTLTLSDIDLSATEAYVGAFVDTDDNGPKNGELIECYENVDFVKAVLGEENATNVIEKTAITIDLDIVLELP